MKKFLILILLASFCGGSSETATVEDTPTTVSTSTTTTLLIKNLTADNPQYFRETLHIYEDSIYKFYQCFENMIQLIEEKNKSNPSTKLESVDENSTSKKEDEQE